jgi:hypothetical protein
VRVARCRGQPGVGIEQDEPADAIGPGGGEQQRHEAGVGVGDDVDRADALGIEHGDDVVDPVREVQRSSLDRVREAEPRAVQRQQPATFRQPAQAAGEVRLVEVGVDRHHPGVQHEQIDRTIAEHRVGDVTVIDGRVAGQVDGQTARHGPCRVDHGRVLCEHCRLETAELGPGLDAQLLAEHQAGILVGAERVALAAGPREGQHAERPPVLVEGVGGEQPVDLPDQRADVAAAVEGRLDPR